MSEEIEMELGEDASFYVPESAEEARRMWAICFASTLTKDPGKIILAAARVERYLKQGVRVEVVPQSNKFVLK